MNAEYDLILMSLVIFVPSIFALGLLFFPKGSEEGMRWWTLFGTAITLMLSLWMFIDYYQQVYDFNRPHEDASTLYARARRADFKQSQGISEGLSHSNWLARREWMKMGSSYIDYYLGVDGISMPLVLLTTVVSFLAMLASWNIDRFVRGYCMLFLILETGMIGTFLLRREGSGVVEVGVGDDRQIIAVGLEGRERRSDFEVRALSVRRPVMLGLPVHRASRGSVHHFNGAEPALRNRRCLPQRCLGRRHGIQKGQPDGHAHAAQDRAPREMLLGNEHSSLPRLLR